MAGSKTAPVRAHAIVTASGYERWSHCTAAPRYEEQFPEGTSEYAEEGTLAHSVCELYGRKKFLGLTTRKFNAEMKKLKADPLWKDEMIETAEFYVNYLAEKANEFDTPPYVAFETRVDLTDYIPDGFGTCDNHMVGGDTLRITDYKHGKGVKVSATNNGQMRLYALGALKLLYPIYGDSIKRVCTAIVQPRITEDVEEEWLTVEELRAWGESTAKPRAQVAYLGLGEFCAGEWCKFCRGRAECRARAAYYAGFEQYVNAIPEGLAVAANDTPEAPRVILTNAEVADLLRKAAGLADWYEQLKEYAVATILAGGEIPDWKVVEGKRSRAFRDTDKALDTLRTAGYDDAVLYERKPLSLAQLEKLVTKKRFAELLSEEVVYAKGKPTLAGADDKRAAYAPVGPGEFAGITNG